MKTKYILHGGFTKHENEQNQAFWRECLADVPDNGVVLLVLFAIDESDTKKEFEDLKARLLPYGKEKHVQFLHANVGVFQKQVNEADMIFLQGGNTNVLLKTLKQYPDFVSSLAGKTVAGSSAGAYVLAGFGTAHSEAHMREGLQVLPLRIVCHHESSKLSPSDTSLEEIQHSHPEFELVFLRDYEYRVFLVQE